MEKVCAWIDGSNTFNPAEAAAVGVDLRRSTVQRHRSVFQPEGRGL
jgi:hypothetical protein